MNTKERKAKIKEYMRAKDYTKAQALAKQGLKRDPNDIYLLRTLWHIYNEKMDDIKCLTIAKTNLRLAPKNVKVLWGYATTLGNMGYHHKAINVYKKILRKSLQHVAYDSDIGTLPRAKGFLNDCRYRIGDCYDSLGEYNLAVKWLQRYLDGRKANLLSYEDKKEARKMIEWGKNTSSIERVIDCDNWAKARLLIQHLLKYYPKNVWLLTQLSMSYYEQYNYAKALEKDEKLFSEFPNDSRVLWNYAGSLDMSEKAKDAIAIYKKILAKSLNTLANGEGGEGVRDARALKNDCRYRLALCYYDLGKTSLAIRWMKKHIENRSPGTSSIYRINLARKHLQKFKKSALKS